MVIRKNLKKKYALISVYKKNNLEYLCKNLKKYNFSFISTGSTSEKIRKLGYDCLNISKLTGFKEILSGRVKTLNSKVYGSILFDRNDKKHIKQFNELNFPKIDIVVINLYPFEEFLKKQNDKKIIEMIDIGGVSLARAASKNYKYVTIISNIKDYSNLITNLNKNKGFTDQSFRKLMATKSFKLTSGYDYSIFNWLENSVNNKKRISLKYGENPDQRSFVELEGNNIYDFKVNGKEISYNNIIDVDSGLKCIAEFNEPTCVIIKHTNPCGVASSDKIKKSFLKALNSDRESAFGGVVLINRRIDKELAIKINSLFFEIIVAPDFDKSALKTLTKKKKLILLKIKKIKEKNFEFRSSLFGNLYQENSVTKINKQFIKLMTSKNITKSKIEDLIFALKVTKYLKSNSMVLVNNKQTIGLGSGQTSRIDALKIAMNKKTKNFGLKKFVCASDGFFPFSDGIKILIKNRCLALAQPSGSINDQKIIDYSIKYNFPLFFTKNRLFKH